MKVLVTGATGFAGRHLVRELQAHGHQVVATARTPGAAPDGAELILADLTDPEATRALVAAAAADAVVHLAGASAFGPPGFTLREAQAGVEMTLNLCRAAADERRDVAFLYVSSRYVHREPQAERVVIDEDVPVEPATPYALAKTIGEAAVRAFAGPRFRAYVARPFAHAGSGQRFGFICPDFARRVLTAPADGRVRIGNPSVRRDICDVRDIVRAYRLIVERRPPGDAYVLGSGRTVEITAVLQRFAALAGRAISFEVDPALVRGTEPGEVLANSARARRDLGWHAEHALDETLNDVFRDVSRRLAGTATEPASGKLDAQSAPC